MYQVVFTGRLLKGAERSTVEIELQRLFKATPSQAEWFLRGKPIVVKSCEDAAMGRRYYDALTKIGLECELRSEPPASTAPATQSTQAAPPTQLAIPQVSATAPRPMAAPSGELFATRAGPSQASADTAFRTEASATTVSTASAVVTARSAPQAERAPGLSRVTQAITAQDRSPVWSAQAGQGNPPATSKDVEKSEVLRRVGGLVFLAAGAVLLGVLAYLVSLEWQIRQPAAGSAAAAPPTKPPVPPVVAPPAQPKSQALDAQLVGRWLCTEAGSGRVVESEFTADGSYRSLMHGQPGAFQQVDQMDVLVQGQYWLEGNTVVLHVQHVPSRSAFGASPRTDDYLFWDIQSLDQDNMSWTDRQVQPVRETCLRSQTLSSAP